MPPFFATSPGHPAFMGDLQLLQFLISTCYMRGAVALRYCSCFLHEGYHKLLPLLAETEASGSRIGDSHHISPPLSETGPGAQRYATPSPFSNHHQSANFFLACKHVRPKSLILWYTYLIPLLYSPFSVFPPLRLHLLFSIHVPPLPPTPIPPCQTPTRA